MEYIIWIGSERMVDSSDARGNVPIKYESLMIPALTITLILIIFFGMTIPYWLSCFTDN